MYEAVYLTNVAFINCQSLKNIEYDLCSGINVIIGLNSSGKSVLYKTIKVAIGSDFFGAKDLQHFICYGQNEAAAMFSFSDESAGGFIATRRSLIYIYRESADSPFQKLTSPHQEFIRKMAIIMDVKTSFVLNLLDPDQELLFINSKERTNFSILKLVADNEELEALFPVLEEADDNAKGYLDRAVKTNKLIHNQFEQLERYDIYSLEQKILYGNSFIPLARSFCMVYSFVQKLNLTKFPSIDFCEYYMLLLKLFCSIKSKLTTLQPIRKLNFEYYDLLLEYYQILMSIQSSIMGIQKSKARLESIAVGMNQIYKELSAQTYCVNCPVKGEVYFFENGCIEAEMEE